MTGDYQGGLFRSKLAIAQIFCFSQAIPVSKEFRTKLISSAFKSCRFLDRQISYSVILS